MKKTFANIRTLAALLIASAALAACSNDDGAIIGEQPAQQQAPQVYTLTLQAGKADNAQTRALDLDGENLVASWADGDQLTVTMADGTVVGTLTAPTASGQTATFSGTLTVPSGKTISGGDKLTLTYHPVASDDYSDQTGTLASAAKCDMATAEVTVATAEGGEITITETSVNFTTQTAVLKITMQDAGGNKINATELKVSAASGTAINIFSFSPTAATYTANGDGILYFALPNAANAQAMLTAKNSSLSTFLSSATVSFTVTKDDESYTINTDKKYIFAAGSYYATTLTKPAPITVTLTPGQIGYLYGGDKKTIGDITIELTGDASFHGAGHMFVKGQFDPEKHSSPEEVTGAGTFTFTSSVGNIKRIDINHEYGSWSGAGAGWPASYDVSENGKFTWSGTPAASVTLNGSQDWEHECSIYNISSIVFTLEK